MSQEDLLEELTRLRAENASLRAQVSSQHHTEPTNTSKLVNGLTHDEYKRYGRQMIVPQVGFTGQLSLKHSKVLVVGAGGLGCPALMYLAGCGIGKIGIVDGDTVDVSNLHRQVMHDSTTVGMMKVESARLFINRLNPGVEVRTYAERLSTDNAFDIFEEWDLVLDCTDSPYSRYLISDVAVVLGKTVVSGSGLKTEGQLSILNFENVGPCYRCFYPTPPPPNSVTSCTDGGVIGPVIGLMGVMMALEAIKIITGTYTVENFKPFLSIYSGYDQQSIRTFKMRGRKKDCLSCSGKITKETIQSEINYSEFCGVINYDVLPEDLRITVDEYNRVVMMDQDHILLDVRPREHYAVVNLPHSINIPWDRIQRLKHIDELGFDTAKPVYTICRFGNDSQYASKFLNDTLGLNTKDIKGGLSQWSAKIDPDLPTY
ncbi:Adenylyltransferase and sulfurtransferase UBA4 [Cyberlindnera fabianii]|uniref:Needs CLA4 to survive protein 3 n=1 Tax=Cyberlindnera fabianii TaxID=36022 RepID=A0A1V2L4M1_CYBFA|nr:Adenylyltransferase and sulfurtransferase UBA4 [Cyberlindnera fabianii]